MCLDLIRRAMLSLMCSLVISSLRISQVASRKHWEYNIWTTCRARPNPVNGVVFKTRINTLGVLVTLPVSARGRSVAAHFIIDTGAPCTYISLSVLRALNLPEVSLCSEVVKVNGVKSALSVSDTTKATHHEGDKKMEVPCHFVGLNILGVDFLDRAGIKLEMDLATNDVVLSSAHFPVAG